MEEGKTYEQLVAENRELLAQLEEATDTIHAIRTGQVDALVVKGADGHQLFTLKTADQTYRVFIEKMNQGAVTLNREGIILYSNSQFAEMVDVPLEKVIGLPFEIFVAKDYVDVYKETFAKGWQEDYNVEVNILSGESLVPFQLSITTLVLDEGISMSIILTDLSFHKETEKLLMQNNVKLAEINAELQNSNNDLQQFASVASHDLQEPLRKILIFATLLKDKHQSEITGDGITFLNKIISSSNRMKTMIFDILSYSRLATNEEGFVVSSINDIITEVIDDYEIVINEKDAQINVGDIPLIEMNRGQMRQVFQNLISNSLKFSKLTEAPVIDITSSLSVDDDGAEYCTITFKDNGIGFNDLYEEKIFSLFQRLNTKDKYEGSGIGLAITRKIIDKHYGTIKANSQEGHGAEFIITLPVKHPKIP